MGHEMMKIVSKLYLSLLNFLVREDEGESAGEWRIRDFDFLLCYTAQETLPARKSL